jgi:hypothetical protein
MAWRMWMTPERKTRTVIALSLLPILLYALALHWNDWRWRDGTLLAVFWFPLFVELYFQRRPAFHSLILCLMWTGVCALDIPVRALPVTMGGFALIAAGIALYVRGPSSFTSSHR